MRKVLAILTVMMVLGVLFSAVGCETTKGVGRDVENLGEGMQGDK